MIAFYSRKWYNDAMATEAKKKAIEKYNKAHYERLYIRLRKEDAEELKKTLGERSINGYVVEAIKEKLQRE